MTTTIEANDVDAADEIEANLAPRGWRNECYRFWAWTDDDGAELTVWIKDGFVLAAEVPREGVPAEFRISTGISVERVVATLTAWLEI